MNEKLSRFKVGFKGRDYILLPVPGCLGRRSSVLHERSYSHSFARSFPGPFPVRPRQWSGVSLCGSESVVHLSSLTQDSEYPQILLTLSP